MQDQARLQGGRGAGGDRADGAVRRQDRVEPRLTRVEASIRHEIWAMRAELRMWTGLIIAGIVVISRRHRRWHWEE